MTALVITGSARHDSHTRRLGAALASHLPGARLADPLTTLPFFNQDLEADPPAVVERLRRQVQQARLVVVVTPEYNGTIPGLLGNAIDWLSRPYAAGALADKPVLAVAASPGPVGGVRALVSLRTVLGNAGAHLLDASLSVSEVHTRFPDGRADEALVADLGALIGTAQASLAELPDLAA